MKRWDFSPSLNSLRLISVERRCAGKEFQTVGAGSIVDRVQSWYKGPALQTVYSGLSKSNFNDHYGDAATPQCLGMIAEINEFSVSDEMLWEMGQTGQCQVDCFRVVGQQQQKSDRRQWHAVTGGRREDWRSTSAAGLDISSVDHVILRLISTYVD